MTEPVRPWTDQKILQGMMAELQARFAGRGVFRASAGRDWIRINLDGDERCALWFTWLPGANLVFTTKGALDPVLKRALPAVRRHPLAKLLNGAVLVQATMFPDDRVAAIHLEREGGGSFFLLHQLFGARGNTVLLADDGRLIWSRHRPPGKLLAQIPEPKIWKVDSGTPEGPEQRTNVSRLAFGHLISRLNIQHLQTYETALGRVRRTTQRLVKNLGRDFANAEKGDVYRRMAEALAANLYQVKQGMETLPVRDLRDGHELNIALDPALPPSANLDVWFRKARKAEKGRSIILQRLEEATEHHQQLELAAERLDEIASSNCQELECLAALLEWHANHAALLPSTGAASPGRGAGRGPHGPEQPVRPFRRYLVDDKYEVWVGRNNKENDELTHRASHSKDIWLHAQGVPGSHVVLRTAGKPEVMPRAVIEKAAAIAALNSKARHSSLVPVIFTERRYVRKPRKAPPGTATCLREKSIFVEPGLPTGAKGI